MISGGSGGCMGALMGQVARRGCLEVDGLGEHRDGGEGGVRWAGLAPSCGV